VEESKRQITYEFEIMNIIPNSCSRENRSRGTACGKESEK